jgi:hypothetical protein
MGISVEVVFLEEKGGTRIADLREPKKFRNAVAGRSPREFPVV